jgi:hypothetical protein
MRMIAMLFKGSTGCRLFAGPAIAVGTTILAIAAATVWSAQQPSPPSPKDDKASIGVGFGGSNHVIHPLSLRITYSDAQVIPGEQGIMHVGTSVYVFRNRLPIPVKIAFPPIGYTSGTSVPITPYCVDVKRMPEFCQAARVLEFAPFAERRFTSGYNNASSPNAPAPSERFVFGVPAGCKDQGVLVDSVESEGAYEKGRTK